MLKIFINDESGATLVERFLLGAIGGTVVLGVFAICALIAAVITFAI